RVKAERDMVVINRLSTGKSLLVLDNRFYFT
ncbi:unnamed protein product, partial [marine sediment metagenome]